MFQKLLVGMLMIVAFCSCSNPDDERIASNEAACHSASTIQLVADSGEMDMSDKPMFVGIAQPELLTTASYAWSALGGEVTNNDAPVTFFSPTESGTARVMVQIEETGCEAFELSVAIEVIDAAANETAVAASNMTATASVAPTPTQTEPAPTTPPTATPTPTENPTAVAQQTEEALAFASATAESVMTATAVAEQTAVVAAQQTSAAAAIIAVTATANAAPPVILIGSFSEPGSAFRLEWQWAGELGPDMYFAVRIGEDGQYERSRTWDKGFSYRISVGPGTEYLPDTTYSWHVALVRDLPPLTATGDDGSWEEITRSNSIKFTVPPGEPSN